MKKSNIKLVIFDLDDTLTVGTTIWELIHKEAGTWKTHGIRYWKEFCEGKFGYNKFLRMDVLCWRGLPLKRLMKAVRRTRYARDIKETFAALKKKEIKIAVVSSSLEIFANYVAHRFGIDHVHANALEVRGGVITGKIRLDVPGLSKGRVTRYLKRKLSLKKSEVMAVGDSSFDIPMFREAGIAISFTDADKKTKAHADLIIPKNNLSKVLQAVN